MLICESVIFLADEAHTNNWCTTIKTMTMTELRKPAMHVLALLHATALLCFFLASSTLSASAEHGNDDCRSRPLSADPEHGNDDCRNDGFRNTWVAGDARMAKLAASGQTLVTVDSAFSLGFSYGIGIEDIIGVEQRNGHVWVSDVDNNRVLELDADGKPLHEISLSSPVGIGVDPNSGAVWTSTLLNQVTNPGAVIKLDPNTGDELATVSGFSQLVTAIGVAPSGRVWIADAFNNQVVVLFGTDKELNGYDASAPSGPHHLRLSGFDEPLDICIDPGNRSRGGESTWVADRNHGQAVKIAPDGTELVRASPTGFFEVRFVSVNSRDGSVWVGDPNSGRIAKLSFQGAEVKNLSINPTALAVDVTDDALWIGTGQDDQATLLKLDSDGTELLSTGGLGTIRGIAAPRYTRHPERHRGD